jgi:hypothetical protein
VNKKRNEERKMTSARFDGKIQETFIRNFNVVKTFFYLCFFFFPFYIRTAAHIQRRSVSPLQRSKWRKTRLFQRPIISIPFRNKVLLFVTYSFELVKIILHVFLLYFSRELNLCIALQIPFLTLEFVKKAKHKF